jgi:hypothetical protein
MPYSQLLNLIRGISTVGHAYNSSSNILESLLLCTPAPYVLIINYMYHTFYHTYFITHTGSPIRIFFH